MVTLVEETGWSSSTPCPRAGASPRRGAPADSILAFCVAEDEDAGWLVLEFEWSSNRAAKLVVVDVPPAAAPVLVIDIFDVEELDEEDADAVPLKTPEVLLISAV